MQLETNSAKTKERNKMVCMTVLIKAMFSKLRIKTMVEGNDNGLIVMIFDIILDGDKAGYTLEQMSRAVDNKNYGSENVARMHPLDQWFSTGVPRHTTCLLYTSRCV